MVSPVRGDYRRLQAEIPLIVLSKFPRPALTSPMCPLEKYFGASMQFAAMNVVFGTRLRSRAK
jgi:hypothetical protein